MGSEKYLIVNADDFGQSPGVNRGIIEAYEHGIVTSTSLMTRWLAAGEAALYAKKHPELSLGLHLDLGEWVYRAGSWVPLYTVVALDDTLAVEHEISRQLDIFRYLVGRDPTHINSHQHIHMREPVRSAALRLCQSLGVPLRNLCSEIHYAGRFYGQTWDGLPLPKHIRLDFLIDMLSTLPAGLSVLICHPGRVDDLKTTYQMERTEELKVLCAPRLQAAISTLGIRLCSFDNWNHLKNSSLVEGSAVNGRAEHTAKVRAFDSRRR
ncbi:MAG: carbohydrate deacetylase [Candidatus Binatia bacterium]